MTKTATKKPLADRVEYFDVDQRSEEWLDLRRGIPTASKASLVIASGRDGDSVGRDKYMKRLAGELITGQVAESFRSEAMERGIRMEPEARAWYARTNFVDLTTIGFVKRTVRLDFPFEGTYSIGCSPDSQVSESKGVEFKTMAPDLLIDVRRRGAGGFPPEHRWQCQWTMWCCGWQEVDLVLYYTGWPRPPVFKVQRSEHDIARLKTETEKFCWELQKLVEEMRA